VTAPERLETERLILRRPVPMDAQAIFSRYSSDPEVTRYLGWPRHAAVDDALGFVHFSNLEWQRWPGGPYLIESRATGALLGGTGLSFETPYRASTGYVLAREAWGLGYATEALRAVKSVAAATSLYRLYALCHPEHAASQRVLEKCGFSRESVLKGYAEFPNLRLGEPCDVVCYTCMLRPV
jgi:RimJ/RimL family protein N-acetyltransferase